MCGVGIHYNFILFHSDIMYTSVDPPGTAMTFDPRLPAMEKRRRKKAHPQKQTKQNKTMQNKTYPHQNHQTTVSSIRYRWKRNKADNISFSEVKILDWLKICFTYKYVLCKIHPKLAGWIATLFDWMSLFSRISCKSSAFANGVRRKMSRYQRVQFFVCFVCVLCIV